MAPARRVVCLTVLAGLCAVGCGDAVTGAHGFDAQRWAGEKGKYEVANLRAGMVSELRDKHLRVGMPREAVRALLGAPDADGPQRDTWFLGRSTVGPSIETWVVDYGADGRVVHFGLMRS